MGAGMLILTYLFMKDFFDRKAGLLAVLLLVINHIFLLETKMGMDSASILHLAAMGSLLLLWRWYSGKGEKYLYSGILMLGLGISIRAWFSWFAAAIFLLSIFYKGIWKKMKKHILRHIMLGGIIFCAGIFLFIFYNFMSDFGTIRYIAEHFFATSDMKIDNSAYFSNLLSRLGHLGMWLDGKRSLIEQGGWYNRTPMKDIAVNPISRGLFLFSFIYLWCIVFFKKSLYPVKRVLFVLSLFTLIMLFSPLTLSSLGGPHLFMLHPIVKIITAVAFIDIFVRFKAKKAILYAAYAVFSIFIFKECAVTLDNGYLYFNRTGGTGNNSDAIYTVSRYLKDKDIARPVIMDWGIYHNLIFLSGGDIRPRTFNYIQGGFDRKGFADELAVSLEKPGMYIFHSREFSNRRDVYDIFTRMCSRRGKNIDKENIFYQRDGKPVFIVYSVK